MSIKEYTLNFLSRKFVFSLTVIMLVSSILFSNKIDSTVYKDIVITISMAYLGSNVASRFVSEKYKAAVDDTSKETADEDASIVEKETSQDEPIYFPHKS